MPFRFLTAEKHHRHGSLFAEMLDWVLAPLFVLWPISMGIEYAVAFSVLNEAYDRELRERVVSLARHVRHDAGRLSVDMPEAVRQALTADGAIEIAFQVRGMKNEVVAGDADLPPAEYTPEVEIQKVYYRDAVLRSREVRVAYVFARVPDFTGAALVQLAEPGDKRVMIASKIIEGVLAAQLLLVPLALLLIWFGLTKGLTPLDDIRATLKSRKPLDLSPINPAEAPEEIRPFIESINELMQRLSQSLEAQQRFVADAAHQMRTPLAGLRTQAELALRQRDLASIGHSMRQIVAGADRASRLVNQLLTLAGTERDLRVPFGRLDLVPLAQETTFAWARRGAEKSIDVGFDTVTPEAVIEGNAMLLTELLNNLLDNAVRYTGAGGRVTSRLVAEGDEVVLEVEDNGIGIDPGEHERVFERFYRVLGTGAEGSGLGLAIVREIADLHRGTVRIVASPGGVGTLVRVSFPRRGAMPLRAAA